MTHSQRVPFNGHYEKRFYDVKTKDGIIYTNQRPNAGNFHISEEVGRLGAEDNILIRPSETDRDYS